MKNFIKTIYIRQQYKADKSIYLIKILGSGYHHSALFCRWGIHTGGAWKVGAKACPGCPMTGHASG